MIAYVLVRLWLLLLLGCVFAAAWGAAFDKPKLMTRAAWVAGISFIVMVAGTLLVWGASV